MRNAEVARPASRRGLPSVVVSAPSSARSSRTPRRNRHDQTMRCATISGAGTALSWCRYAGNNPQIVKAATPAASPREERRNSVMRGAAGSSCSSRPAGRKTEHLVDVLRCERQHQRAIETEGHTGTVREPGRERCEQALIWRPHRLPGALPLGVVALEARALLDRRLKLMEAVGELDTLAVELEAQRRPRILRIEARERRLGRRIAVDEGEGPAPEAGADADPHQELEKLIAVRAGGLEPEVARGFAHGRVRGGEGIERELACERLAIAEALAATRAVGWAQEDPRQRLHLVHECPERKAEAVPLDEGELRVV